MGTGPPQPKVEEIVVADPPERWAEAGFTVAGDLCRIGGVRVRLAGDDAGRGLVSWSLSGMGEADLDGLPTAVAPAEEGEPAGEHPNGTLGIDHVVAFTPRLDRTVTALEAAGLPLRRIREGPTPAGAQRQAFFRLAEVILEVVEHPPGTAAAADSEAPARLWGLALGVAEIERPAACLGEHLGSPRDAVQPGRRIATLRRSAGLSVPVAFITRGEGAA